MTQSCGVKELQLVEKYDENVAMFRAKACLRREVTETSKFSVFLSGSCNCITLQHSDNSLSRHIKRLIY